ncbi:MAG: hypothetical protein ACSHXL_01565 [Bacteroidota bacterium]
MKPLDVIYTWLITLILGLILLSIGTGRLELGPIFTIVAGLFSIPYLFIMILASKGITKFWVLQLVHLLITCFTALVIYGMDEEFVSDLFWAVFPYFGLGLAVQAYWWFKYIPSKNKPTEN